MIQTFNNNTLLLTANTRLSTYLKRKYADAQLETGKKTWPTLCCLPFDQWIREIAEDFITTHNILNDAQELALWKNIISQSDNHNAIYHPFKIAAIAQQSWHLLKQWHISLNELSENFSEDVRQFHQWATTFTSICKKQQWIIQDDCANVLIQALKTSDINLPKDIIIAGFDELTPQKKSLLALLEQQTSVRFYAPSCASHTPSCTKLLNEDQEILNMAHWAKKILIQQPDASIGCIAPHLNHIQDKVISIFTDVFSDNAIDILNKKTYPFNISASCTFYENPLIHTAFKILSLDKKEIELANLSTLLRSPFIKGSEIELTSRARLNELLHQMEERASTLSTIVRIAEKNSLCPQLIIDLKSFIAEIPSPGEKQNLNTWKDKISTMLNTLGWPGERVLDSNEYQQYQRWQKLLIEFTEIDVVYDKPVTFFQAILQLKLLSQKTKFQSETQQMPIQILGMLEASGMTFDYLWVMGMNDDKWPQAPSPHPFIPIGLQRKYNMPHASSEKEFLFSQAITKRLQQSSEHILFSYSEQKEDTALRISKLIEGIPENTDITHVKNTHFPIYTSDLKELGIALDILTDNIAPPINTDERARGGASILKDQSACPFRAFAKHRLGAKTLPTPKSGLSPQERGNLIHHILENIWHALQNHTTLWNYQEDALDALIKENIAHVLTKKSEHRPFILKKQFVSLEKKRLFKLIKGWLDIEKSRPPFSVIAQETARKIDFEGLTLKLRIDREDTLENGERIIIDYKTGLTDIKSWFGQRPDDPQLPLYCLTNENNIDGLLFAQVRTDAPQFKGITADDYNIPGVKTIQAQKADPEITDWETFKQAQYQTLSLLSKDFQSGIAHVDPKNPNQTCQYCDLKALCRVHVGI
jgi:ATP-dependent helicase/nuclease subunit B